MLKPECEFGEFGRLAEIRAYYETDGAKDTLEKALTDLTVVFRAIDGYKIGRGASHVWVHDNMDRRIFIVRERR